MKQFKRVFSLFTAALLIFGIAAPAVYAVPGSDTSIITISGAAGIFEFDYGDPGHTMMSLTVPFWETAGGSTAFCLESDQHQPEGDSYHMSESLYSEVVAKGIRAILLHGVPNSNGGLGTTEARYATQTAIWSWMLEAAGVGYPFYAESRLFPAAGKQDIFDFYLQLLDYARRGIDTVNYTASYAPNPLVLTGNGSGQLVGDGTMELSKGLTYSIDQSKLPTGATLTGSSHADGVTFTLTVPASYVGQTFTINDCFRLNSTCAPANIFWFEPAIGKLQKMVVYDVELQQVHSMDLAFTSAYTARVKIVKLDGGTGKVIPAAGTSFKIKNLRTGEWVEQGSGDMFVTGPDGTITLPEPLPGDEYELYEAKAPAGYLRTETPVKFTVQPGKPNEVVTVEMGNTPVMGKITVEKRGEQLTGAKEIKTDWGNQFEPVFEMKHLAGAEFEIIAANDIVSPDSTLRAQKGEVVDRIVMGSDGKATSKALHLGDYLAVETKCPAGFVMDPSPYPVSLTYADQTAGVVSSQVGLTNKRVKADIRLKKIWEMPVDSPKGFAPWKDILFGLYAKKDILASDGTVIIPAGSLIEVVGIDADGNGAVSVDLPIGSYVLRELTTAKGYKLDDTEYSIEFSPDGKQSVVVVSVSATNKILRGSLKIIKLFEGSKAPIAGVPFTVTGKTTLGTEVKIDAKIDANGEILLEGLPVGEYVVTELASELTKGYVLSEVQTVAVATDEIAELEILNKRQRGSLKIVKTFEGQKKPIAGIKFSVEGTTTSGERFFEEYEIDKKGEILIKDLPVGEYVVREVASELNMEYILAANQTVVIEPGELTELSIENKRIIGLIKIKKVDAVTGEPVEGAEFGLYQGLKRIATATSDADGWALFVNIPYGDYEIRELKAAPGYKKTDARYKVEIRKHDVAVEFDVPNEPIPGNVPPGAKPPKTGDNSLVVVWIALAVLGAAGAVTVLLLRKRRREEEQADALEET